MIAKVIIIETFLTFLQYFAFNHIGVCALSLEFFPLVFVLGAQLRRFPLEFFFFNICVLLSEEAIKKLNNYLPFFLSFGGTRAKNLNSS